MWLLLMLVLLYSFLPLGFAPRVLVPKTSGCLFSFGRRESCTVKDR